MCIAKIANFIHEHINIQTSDHITGFISSRMFCSSNTASSDKGLSWFTSLEKGIQTLYALFYIISYIHIIYNIYVNMTKFSLVSLPSYKKHFMFCQVAVIMSQDLAQISTGKGGMNSINDWVILRWCSKDPSLTLGSLMA